MIDQALDDWKNHHPSSQYTTLLAAGSLSMLKDRSPQFLPCAMCMCPFLL